jgi:hypothetical protein
MGKVSGFLSVWALRGVLGIQTQAIRHKAVKAGWEDSGNLAVVWASGEQPVLSTCAASSAYSCLSLRASVSPGVLPGGAVLQKWEGTAPKPPWSQPWQLLPTHLDCELFTCVNDRAGLGSKCAGLYP